MAAQEIKSHKLFLYDPSYSKTYTDIYIGSAPGSDRAHQKLIVIAELPRGKNVSQSLVDDIVERSVSVFESSDHSTPELVLEAILNELNDFIPELAAKKHRDWLYDLRLLVAISDRGQLHFSQLGNLRSLLVQDNGIADVSESPDEINPLKIFSHVTSGLLNPGDALVFTTASLTDYIAESKIKSILEQFPPSTAAKRLESLLMQVPPFVAFAAVIIKFTTELDELAVRSAEIEPEVVPTRLPVRQAAASRRAEYGEPQMTGRVQYMESRRERTNGSFDQPSRYHGFGPLFRSLTLALIRSLALYLAIIWRLLVLGIMALWTLLRSLVSNQTRKEQEERLIYLVRTRFETWKLQLQRMPRLSRIMLYTIGAIAFVLLNVLLVQSQERAVIKSADTYNQTLAAISEKRQAAENAIIYKDEKAAEQLFLAIDELLRGLRPHSQKEAEQIARYVEENTRDLNRVRHINYVSAPLVAADFSAWQEQDFSALTESAGTLYLTADAKLVKSINGSTESVADAPTKLTQIANIDGTIFAIAQNNKAYRLSVNTLEPVTLQLQSANKAIDAVTTYAGNLYILDRGAKSVFKHSGNNSGFQAGSVWMTDADLLSSASGIATDGDMYVINQDGNVIKLLRGKQQSFDYHEPTPHIGKNARIITRKDPTFIYLTDPDNQRVIILSKDGTIKDQFTSPKFNDLKALTPNGDETTLYVLSGKTVYSLAINK